MMLNIDEVFKRKCHAFSVGDTQTVADSLADCSHVNVGATPLNFLGQEPAKALLDDYRTGLLAQGYAHTQHTVKEINHKDDDQAIVKLSYTHMDWHGKIIDILNATYILAKDEALEWKCFVVEFPMVPVAFSTRVAKSLHNG